MATIIRLPKLGQTMEEGTIVEWFKREGDPVERGEVLFSLESDKAVLEVEARTKGVLRKVLLEPGVKVPVKTPVAIVGAADEDIEPLLEEARGDASGIAPSAPAAEEPVPPREEKAPAAGPASPAGRVFASPRARKTAAEKGVDLTQVQGSGPDGRIVERDVLAHLERRPAATPLARRLGAELGVPMEQVVGEAGRVRAADVRAAAAAERVVAPAEAAEGALTPMSGLRAIIAERMAASAHTAAAVTLHTVVDATEFVALRTRLKEALEPELGFNLGYNDLLAHIAARCLRQFAYMNVRLEEGGIRRLEEVNIGLAVDSERGLLVPVLREADKLGLAALARAYRELVERARAGKAGPDELTGGTFTITNLGMFGVDMFTPIINLPECAILGVGRIRPEPVVQGDQVVVRQRMWLSLTFDHRLVDGAPAARFLQALCGYIESPYLLLA